MAQLLLRRVGKTQDFPSLFRSGTETAKSNWEGLWTFSEQAVAIQLFSDTSGITIHDAWVEYLEKPLQFRVGDDIIGRIFNGLGEPIDGYPAIFSSDLRDINGQPINPSARVYPRDFIQTGISAIDGMNTLIRGQKAPYIFRQRIAAQQTRRSDCPPGSGARPGQPVCHCFCGYGHQI